MKVLSRTQLREYVAGHRVLSGTPERPGILRTSDDRIIKAFYTREKQKKISRNLIRPRAKRFAANGRNLERLGVVAPRVEELVFCREIPVHMVRYPVIDGGDVRKLCEREDDSGLELLAGYLADLHRQGVYFRGIHLGNVMKTGEGSLALLDIADLQTSRRALSPWKRARNIAHLFNADEEHFTAFGPARFLSEYFEASGLGSWQQELLRMRMQWRLDDPLQRRLAG